MKVFLHLTLSVGLSVCADALQRVLSSVRCHSQAEQTPHTTVLGTLFSKEGRKPTTPLNTTPIQEKLPAGATRMQGRPRQQHSGYGEVPLVQKAATRLQ